MPPSRSMAAGLLAHDLALHRPCQLLIQMCMTLVVVLMSSKAKGQLKDGLFKALLRDSSLRAANLATKQRRSGSDDRGQQ